MSRNEKCNNNIITSVQVNLTRRESIGWLVGWLVGWFGWHRDHIGVIYFNRKK